MDEAKDVFHSMMQRNVVPDVFTYSKLIDGYCLQGKVYEARNVFNSMASKSAAPDVHTYNILIKGYCKKKMIDDAMHVFRDMHSEGLNPDLVTYNTLLKGLISCSDRCSSALQLFDVLQAIGLKPNFFTYCNLLDCVETRMLKKHCCWWMDWSTKEKILMLLTIISSWTDCANLRNFKKL